MAREVIVEPGQSLEDIALQGYGSIDGTAYIVMDNEAVFVNGFSTRLEAGTRLTLRDEPIDLLTYNTARKLRVVPATMGDAGPDPIGPGGDYNDDFNNDHFIDA